MNTPLHNFVQAYFEVFDNFIKNRIEKYGLIDGEDYIVFNKIIENPSGGRPLIEYALSIDAAKEIAILRENEDFIQIFEQSTGASVGENSWAEISAKGVAFRYILSQKRLNPNGCDTIPTLTKGCRVSLHPFNLKSLSLSNFGQWRFAILQLNI